MKLVKGNLVPEKVSDLFDIYNFGNYRAGMPSSEIEFVLDEVKKFLPKFRSISRVKLSDRFNKIAGVNTMGLVSCEHCNRNISVMYRHDVERFMNQLFFGTGTYFD